MMYFPFRTPSAVRCMLASLMLAFLAGCASPGGTSSAVGLRQPDSLSRQGITAPDNLWHRVRRGFAMPDLVNSTVLDKEAYYSQRPDYLQRMIGRSNKYLFHVVEELERRRMPTELALLPFVESAFNPQAVSSAKAAGMWQFIPSTGRHYALTQNAFRDDR
ncbi:MAG: transglycosylase SLT domain-containing protein, partial [Brachymonas sp.]|nr:transglycosylase SLT domain-containing protein [Brachymonas sp.]